MTSHHIPPKALALLALLTLVWGTNWPLFPIVLKEMSVWTFRAISLSAGGALLLWAAKLRGQSLAVPRRDWFLLVSAAFGYLAVWNVASAYSAMLIPSGQSAVLGFTMPLWLALLSWAFMGQRFTPRLLLALAFGAAGVALLMVPSFAAYAQAPLGMGLGLLAGLGWAVGTLVLKRRPIPIPTTVLTGWQLLLTAVPVTFGALFLAEPHALPTPKVMALVAYIVVVPMCVGNLCWFAIVGMLPANVAGLSSIMVPVVAMVSGAIVHGEPLGLAQWAAIGCTVVALSLVLLAPQRSAKQ